jgi:hypothetical protein
MAIVHSGLHRDVTLLSYGARVAFAAAILVIGLKVTVDHWPCDIARIAGCPAWVRHASAPPASTKKVVFLKPSHSGPLPAIAEKMAAAAEGRRLFADIAGVSRRTGEAPAGP